MNKLFFGSACGSLLITVAHIFGGGPQFHTPVLDGAMAADAKAVYSILWHFASGVMTLNTLALFQASFKVSHSKVAIFISLQYLLFAGLFIAYGAIRLGSLFILPQWTIFLVIAALAALGVKRDTIT